MTYDDLVSLAEKSRELEDLSDHPWLQTFRLVFHADLRDFLTTQKCLEAKGNGKSVLGPHTNNGEPFLCRLSYEFFERAEESTAYAESLVEEGRKVWEDRWEEMGCNLINWSEQLNGCWENVKVYSQLCQLFLRVAEGGVEAV